MLNGLDGRIKLIALAVIGLVAVLVTMSVGKQIVATNDAGYYQIKQAALSGTMTVREEPGTYARFFANITTYHISDMLYFSGSDLDGGKNEANDAIIVRFNGGGTAKVSGTLKFRLSTSEADELLIHQDFKNFDAVKHDLIRQTVQEALNKTAALMKAEESFSTRFADFTRLAEDQIRYGVYATMSRSVKSKDADGNESSETVNEVQLDSSGKPTIYKPSPFNRYHIEVLTFTIKSFEYDDKTQGTIDARKGAEQARVLARSNAEKAQQDAITAKAQGEAMIATEKATQEVEKVKQVTIAQKEFEVSQLRRKQAEQDSQSAVVKGKAEAEVNKLKVAAGLTPLERANIQKDTAIGVAEQLAKVQFPGMMIIGGNGSAGGGAAHANPFDAVGLESFMRISKKLSDDQVQNRKNKKDEE